MAFLDIQFSGSSLVHLNLRRQFAALTLMERDCSRVGFFSRFTLQDMQLVLPDGPALNFGDVVGEIDGLQNGFGLVCFVKNGIVDSMEGFTFDELWPEGSRAFSLRNVETGETQTGKICLFEKEQNKGTA